jgi:hypothetical protein
MESYIALHVSLRSHQIGQMTQHESLIFLGSLQPSATGECAMDSSLSFTDRYNLSISAPFSRVGAGFPQGLHLLDERALYISYKYFAVVEIDRVNY